MVDKLADNQTVRLAQALEAVREALWNAVGDAARRAGMKRSDMIALLVERGLSGGFSAAETDRFIGLFKDFVAGILEPARHD